MTLYINKIPVNIHMFSSGECHPTLVAETASEVQLYAELFDANAVMSLLLVVDALRRKDPNVIIRLTLPYFPYARQDRVCNEGEAFGVEVMAGLINNLDCQTVTIFDPHSDVTTERVKNVVVKTLGDLFLNTSMPAEVMTKDYVLVSPDAGALDKVSTLAQGLRMKGYGQQMLQTSKKRDTKTGRILYSTVEEEVEHKDYLIVDDICDGGSTFISLAKVLHEKGAKSVALYVTHGIFSQGLDVLKQTLSHVYCHHRVGATDYVDDFLTIVNPNPHK